MIVCECCMLSMERTNIWKVFLILALSWSGRSGAWSAEGAVECPTWSVPAQHSNGSSYCECGSELNGRVQCHSQPGKVFLLPGYCMTFEPDTNQTVVGSCPYTIRNITPGGYIELPSDITELNGFMCKRFNREGALCGKCKEGYSPGVATFLYDSKCVDCSSVRYGWLAFITVQLMPVTIFFILVLFFQVSAVSPAMNAFVFVCQLTTLQEYVGFVTAAVERVNPQAAEFKKVLFSLYSMWNLDLLRPLIPNLCLSPKINDLHALVLELTAGSFLVFLTIVTLVCIKLHERDFRPIVCMWRPFYQCCIRFRRTWNLRNTMIDAFATFLLISYVKLAIVVIKLFNGVQFYDPEGKKVGWLYYYYDATVPYFGKEHLPFITFAILSLLIAIVPPALILTLYQLKIFQRCLSHCPFRLHVLHTFVEKQQGCFKNGSSGGADLRFFAGLYFILRIVFVSFIITLDLWVYIIVLLCIAMSLSFALLRPYKKDVYNWIDTFFFALLGMIFYTKILAEKLVYTGKDLRNETLLIAFLCTLTLLPLLYIILFTFYWLAFKMKLLQKCYRQILQFKNRRYDIVMDAQPLAANSHEMNVSFPDRVANPNHYMYQRH